jgi:hypothetical protein
MNIKAGIYGDNLFRLYVHSNSLAERNCKAFLKNNMPDFWADMPLIICQELDFMYDGAPAQFSLIVHMYLNIRFPGQ